MRLASQVDRSRRGASLTEYALIIALLAVVTMGILLTLGGNIKTTFTEISDCISGKGC
jgi:Flp pilus assembly pilin Flp